MSSWTAEDAVMEVRNLYTKSSGCFSNPIAALLSLSAYYVTVSPDFYFRLSNNFSFCILVTPKRTLSWVTISSMSP
jgi:hypothetical protein